MSNWEEQLDARLREVPLPAGMLARLQEIAESDPSLSDAELAILSDDALDEQLCSVEVPSGLLEGVEAGLAVQWVGEEIDTRLADVAVPRSLIVSLRTIPWQLTHRRQWQRLATAAALFVAVSVGYFSAMTAWLASFRYQPTQEIAWVEVQVDPIALEGETLEAVAIDESGTMYTSPQAEAVAIGDEPSVDMLLTSVGLPEPDSLDTERSPTREINAQFATSQGWKDLLALRYDLLGSPSDASDRLPSLETLARPTSSGFVPPLVRGFDRKFLFTEGVHPIVQPEAHPQLRKIDIPLTTSTDSFELAWQRLREGKLPDEREVHIADFIAAMEYPLPAVEPGKVGLRTAAGPSPFGKDGARLLQVCVQAGPLVEGQRHPTHLTVALDISASMNLGGKLDSAKRSLRHMLAHLGERDQVSLLLFNEEPRTEILTAGKDDAAALEQLLNSITGTGGTNLAAGLQRAASLAMSESAAGAERKLVLVTDGRAPLPHQTQQALAGMLTELNRKGLEWTVLDLSTGDEADADLDKLARLSHGKLKHAPTSSEAQWLLTDLLVGHPTIVAPDASLRIHFNPQTVAGYRLIGHEPSRQAGLDAPIITIDLRSGQTATGLLEVWLKPNSNDDVAHAELVWREPASGEPRSLQQKISRLQFASTFAESALSLQAAAIAAETGEILKGSPFAESRNRSLAEVERLTYRVAPRLADRAGYQRFVAFITAAERLRTDRVVPK
jgi:Ca-activated chloride channel family protein